MVDSSNKMDVRTFLSKYRSALNWGLIILTEFHILLGLMEYIIPEHTKYIKLERVYCRVLLAAAVIYVIMAAVKAPERLKELKSLGKRLFTYEQLFLVALIFLYIISCYIQARIYGANSFSHNRNRMTIVIMCALIFFPMAEYIGGKKITRAVEIIFHVTLVFYTTFCVYVLWNYYHRVFITFPSGRKVSNYGNNVSLMIGSNRNITGTYAVIMIAMCIYMLVTLKRRIKVAYIPVMAVHIIVAILANSRTSFLITIFLVTVTALMCLRNSGLLEKRELYQKIAIYAVVVCLCFVAMNWLRGRVFAAFAGSSGKASAVTEKAEVETGIAEIEIKEANEEDTVKNFALPDDLSAVRASAADAALALKEESAARIASGDIVLSFTEDVPGVRIRTNTSLSGREEIWLAALNVMLSSPYVFLFGVTPSYVSKWLQKPGGLSRSVPHCHNVFIQVGASLGAPAMIGFIVFAGLIAWKSIRIMFTKNKRYKNQWVIPMIILSMLITEMVEVMIFAIYRANVPVFYLLAGYIVAMDRRIQMEDKMSRAENVVQ